jgi:D-beta-D-heptose 7-phosphate kinase/D-beta-D-heptose 1-phosphate adenosyltransferase
MNYQQALHIVRNFAQCRLIVLGDLMLDKFVWGEVRRISPEAPVPVVEVKNETLHAGGAGNVVVNLTALGASAVVIGVVGDDANGKLLTENLKQRGGDIRGVIADTTRPTTLKTRIIAHSQQMLRTDHESRLPISTVMESEVIRRFDSLLASADAVIVSDYDKGLLTPRILQATLEMAKARKVTVCLDPKIKNFMHYRPVTVITPNQSEAERASGIEITDEASLRKAAKSIRERLNCPNVLITRGEQGMSLLDENNSLTHIPTFAREVYDVTGAGDTVIATLALSMAAGAQLSEAAIIANHAAGIVVGKIGTAVSSRTELEAALTDVK